MDDWNGGGAAASGSVAPRFGGFVSRVARFDADAFGVNPAEAHAMDPQQRRLLTWTSRALSDAKLENPQRSTEEPLVGVYVGAATTDYGKLASDADATPSATAATGSAFLSVTAGRCAFTLNTRGPAIAIDTACSSGLVATHAARAAIDRREDDRGDARRRQLQVVAGVNFLLHRSTTAMFHAAGMLAPDGRCKSLDASADGYVRGEACVVLALDCGGGCESSHPGGGNESSHPAAAAAAVVVVVVGSGVNQDGRSGSLTAPNGPSQRAVMRAARREADAAESATGTAPRRRRLATLQTHGTGTPLGDPIEIGAAVAVAADDDDPDRVVAAADDLLLGATKASVAHAESPAGLIGLLAAITTGLIGASNDVNPHLRWVNPHVAGVLEAAKKRRERSAAATRQRAASASFLGRDALAGASAFAFQGTNAHALVAKNNLEGITDVDGALRMWSRVATTRAERRFWLAPAPHPLIVRASADGGGGFARFHVGSIANAPRASSLRDHAVNGRSLMPCAGFLELIRAAVAFSISSVESTAAAAAATRVVIASPLDLRAPDDAHVRVRVDRTTGAVKCDAGTGTGTGTRVKASTTAVAAFPTTATATTATTTTAAAGPGPPARTVFGRRASFLEEATTLLASLARASSDVNDDDYTSAVSPAELDNAFQSVSAAWTPRGGTSPPRGLNVPTAVDAFLATAASSDCLPVQHASSSSFASSAVIDHGSRGYTSQHGVATNGVVVRGVRAKPMRRRAARSFDSDEIAVVAANAIDAPELTVLIPASQATPSRHRGRSNREDIANSPAAASRSPFGAIARSCACVYAAAAAAAAATSRDDESLSGVTVAGGERLGVDGGARAMDAELGSRVRVRASSLDGRARVAVRAPASDWFSVRRTTTHRTLARRLLAPASDCLPVHVRTHQKSSAPPSTFDAAASSSSSSCVVTGGTGALGVVFAAAATDAWGCSRVTLLSRVGRRDVAVAATRGAGVTRVVAADASTRADTSAWHDAIGWRSAFRDPPLGVLLHAGGVLRDAAATNASAGAARAVVASKKLHDGGRFFLTQNPARALVFFSSIASCVGSAGQIPYSAANASLDSASATMTREGLPAASTQWGPFDAGGGGMVDAAAVRASLARSGFGLLARHEGVHACERVMCGLENGRRNGVTFAAVTCASRTDWAVVASRRPGADVARFLEDILDDDDVGANTRAIDQRRTLLVTTTDAPRVDMNRHDVNTNAAAVRIPLRDVLDAVRSVVASLAGRDVSADEPLMDAGLDSLTAVDARAEVSKTFNVTLPATALFDYPTAEALATRVWGELAPPPAPAAPARAVVPENAREAAAAAAAAVVAFSSAGGAGPHDAERVRTIPPHRWDVETARVRGVLPAAFGSFLASPETFDNDACALSLTEASVVDVQQRLALDAISTFALLLVSDDDETGGKRAFHGTDTGVYVGVASRDYDDISKQVGVHGQWSPSALAAAASFGSVVPGRASFTFALTGPSIAIDTACSSSLVAAKIAFDDVAVAALPVCGAVVLGVNVTLTPRVTETFRAAGMLSPTGRCKTLDASADGYVRAEECRAVSLKGTSASASANASFDGPGDAVVVVGGAGVNQDGRSSSLTAPNGPSQQAVIRAAMTDDDYVLIHHHARVLHMHGTGTPLGDPIEIGAAVAVFAQRGVMGGETRREKSLRIGVHRADAVVREPVTASSPPPPLRLESSKAWTGHAEPAAGALGLVVLCANASEGKTAGFGGTLRVMNPHVVACVRGGSGGGGIVVAAPRATAPLPMRSDASCDGVVRGGVSAFAFQGTNAHVRVVVGTTRRRNDRDRAAGFWRDDAISTTAHRRRAWIAPPTPLSLSSVAMSDEVNDAARFDASALTREPRGNAFEDHVVAGEALFPGAGMLHASQVRSSHTGPHTTPSAW